MRLRNSIVLAALVFLPLWPASAGADAAVDKRVDSLFVIASSLDIKYRDQVEPARDSIAALGIAAVPRLIELLGTPHGRERAPLEEIFKKIGAAAVPLLNDALLTTDSLRLARVAKVLSYSPDTSSVKNLLQVAGNRYFPARYDVILTLGKIGDGRATETVRAALHDTVELVRTAAAVSAGRLKDSTLIPDLLAALNDEYYGVRMAAHEELKNLDCSAKQNYFPAALSDTSAMVRKNLLAILADDSCRYPESAISPSLTDPDPLVQSMALKAVYRINRQLAEQWMARSKDNVRNFILRQTITDLTEQHETKPSAKP